MPHDEITRVYSTPAAFTNSRGVAERIGGLVIDRSTLSLGAGSLSPIDFGFGRSSDEPAR